MSRPKIFTRDDRLRVRLRQSADPKPKEARLKRVKVSGIETRGSVVRGTIQRATPVWHQRVTVKIKYRERYGTGAKADKSYARALNRQVAYNTRTDAQAKAEGVQPLDAFNARHERINAHEAVRDWGGDRRYWKMIISPEHGNDMKDFLAYTREVMAAIEKDLLTDDERKRGVRLEWVGAIHDDTDHKHAHIIMRGSIEGRDLTLGKAYLTSGIRARASKIATDHLGYRRATEGPTRGEAGDDPTEYLEIAYRVPERRFGAWPAAMREGFAAARSETTGKPVFRLETRDR